jgi:hypothetical protein
MAALRCRLLSPKSVARYQWRLYVKGFRCLLVVLRIRADGQKVLLAVRNMIRETA